MNNVLITGCSSGFGKRVALALARRGDRVFATVRRPEAQEALEALARDLPLSVYLLDVTDTASIDRALAEIADEAPVDALINNAGYALRGPVASLSDEEVARQLDTNVGGVIRMIRGVVPGMRERGSGTIINLSSAAGLIGIPFEGAYVASKHAVEGLSETLRFELAAHGVKVVLIEPGAFDTGFFGNVAESTGFPMDHPDRPAAARFSAAVSGSAGDRRADPQAVVDEILGAVDDPDASFRRLVGQDAELVSRLKREAFDQLENGILGVLAGDAVPGAAAS